MATYKGNLLSKTAPTVSTAGALGIWRSVDLMQASYAGNWPATYVPVTGDTYWPYVSLLLPGNGTNGGQNNTFLDSSTNAFSLTRTGNTTQGTFSPFGTNWSCLFDGTGDTIVTAAASTQLTMTGDATIEFWMNSVQSARCDVVSPNYAYTQTGWFLISFGYTTTGGSGSIDYVEAGGGSAKITGTLNRTNTWNHIALTRSGTSVRLFVNGTQVGSTYTTTQTQWGASGSGFIIGNQYNSSVYYNGFISNLRVLKGTALYTSNFTPPTTPLTAITNTALLICNANRFVDGSTNSATITPAGDTVVKPDGPFNFTASYSAATNGGSLYFDGVGDYLTAANNAAFSVGTGAFTIDGWLNVKAWQTAGVISCDYANNIHFSIAPTNFAGVIYMWVAGAEIHVPVADAPPLNTWFHVAAVRQAGGTTKIYINGVAKATGTLSGNGSTTSSLTVGASSHSLGEVYSGHMSNMRFVKGTAIYTADFTPPTAPTTAVSGTSLLLNGTNANIIDNTLKTDLETVGNASISTAQSKWGGSSMYFDGAGDYLLGLVNRDYHLSTTPFTIEAWLRVSTWQVGGIISNDANNNFTLMTAPLNFAGCIYFYVVSTLIYVPAADAPATNTWFHLACVRNSSNLVTIYINGVSKASGTASGNGSTTVPLYVGANSNNTGEAFNGYINDLRFTKGIARYTSNFSVPTAAFPTT